MTTRVRAAVAATDAGYLLFGLFPVFLLAQSVESIRGALLSVQGIYNILVIVIPILAIVSTAVSFFLGSRGNRLLLILSVATIPSWLLLVTSSVTHHLQEISFIKYGGYLYLGALPIATIWWFGRRRQSAKNEAAAGPEHVAWD